MNDGCPAVAVSGGKPGGFPVRAAMHIAPSSLTNAIPYRQAKRRLPSFLLQLERVRGWNGRQWFRGQNQVYMWECMGQRDRTVQVAAQVSLTPLPPIASAGAWSAGGIEAISPIISTRSMRSLRSGAGRSSFEETGYAVASAAKRRARSTPLVSPQPRLPRDGH